ncbi:MAG: antitoxin family protein [Acidobacteriota bacterium]
MSQTIEAIYENGVFKPLRPVTLPEGSTVLVDPGPATDDLEEKIKQELLAAGSTPDKIEKILANFRLLWESYSTLTPEQKQALEEARFNQANFISHGSRE